MNIIQDCEHHFHMLTAANSYLDQYVLHLRATVDSNVVIRVIKCLRVRSKIDILDEFAAALQFPSYFGRNWDALEECLGDLQWLPAKGYIFIISDAGSLLKIDAENVKVLFEILDKVSKDWEAGGRQDDAIRESVPFHVILQDTTTNIQELRRLLLPIVGDIPVIGNSAC